MRTITYATLTLALLTGAARGADPIRPAHFDKLRGLIKPQATEEKFMQIPWLTDLWDARKVAAREGKPILLWEMDGHPLSCV